MQLKTTPPDLPGHTVAVVLDYLYPTLSLPLPTHLLSTPLIQRHHFLNINPENASEYLSWPLTSANNHTLVNDNLIEVLAALAPREGNEGIAYPIRYTADGETTYAHVLAEAPSLQKTARIVFQWDGSEAWKYHDASTAPLPSPNFGTLQEAMSVHTTGNGYRQVADGREPSEDGHDDYWDSYGVEDGDHEAPYRSNRSHEGSIKGEDAYWAQYSSVHGTADSTIPSPVPEKARRNPYGDYPDSNGEQENGSGSRSGLSSRSDRPLPIPPQNPFRSGHHREDGEPPSPHTLSTLLEAIPDRAPLNNGEALDSPTSFPRVPASGHKLSNGSAGITRPREDTIQTVRPQSSPPSTDDQRTPPATSPEEVGLKQAIAGLYHMWRMGRQAQGGIVDPESFISVVRQAIEQ